MTNTKSRTINTIHFDITEFCNYHCEYCYQGLEKHQIHISDTIYENFFNFLATLKEAFNVHLIGGEPFLYPRFYEMCERIVKMGHTISCTTNFSLPKNCLDKFLEITKGHIAFWEISMHLTQIKDFEEFYEKLSYFKNKSELNFDDFQINCVLTEENFEKVKKVKEKIESLGFKLNIQRIFDENDYCIYSEGIENWLKNNKCIDIPLNMVVNKERCDVCKKPCRTGNKFFKVLINGKVTRCFTNQEYGYSLLGDFSKNSDVKILKDFTPCLSLDNKCRCLMGFNKLGQIDNKKNKYITYFICKSFAKIRLVKLYLSYYFNCFLCKITIKQLREKSQSNKLRYQKLISEVHIYGY